MNQHLHQAITGLVEDHLTNGETIRFRVTSNSMAPLIQRGDTIFVENVPPVAYRIGDVLVIRRERDYLTHRLIHKAEAEWLTKGDNTLHPDPPVAPEAIIGRVTRIQHEDSLLDLQTAQQRRFASLLARLSRLEWQAYCASRFLRIPVRIIIKGVQRIAKI